MQKAPECLHCKSESALVTGADLYPHREDLKSTPFYHCKGCDAACGCHPDTIKPLGYPANKATRQARQELHERYLDPIWKNPKATLTRTQVYRYLGERMGLRKDDTHVGMFTLDQCEQAVNILRELAGKPKNCTTSKPKRDIKIPRIPKY